ncbi:MAG: TRM11 family SAM-dependent methyltransferase [Candidatus Kariarchaeaceae archaeon]|jgi:tRNA G10  N-methylase Trm11
MGFNYSPKYYSELIFSVNLSSPSLVLLGISFGEKTAVGWQYGENSYATIAWREPKNAPFFRGGTMKPRLCKLLVNLLFPLDAVVLDPFCGHGGILREIADTDSFAVGIEIDKKIVRELKENNRFFKYDDRIAIILGNALKPPIRSKGIQMAIFDPPYAIQTTTKGFDPSELIIRWLETQFVGTKVVLTTSLTILDVLPKGWVVDFDEHDYVHKSLTRRARRIRRE